MSIITLVNKIAKEELWTFNTYEEWANDAFVNEPNHCRIGFFCFVDSFPIGQGLPGGKK